MFGSTGGTAMPFGGSAPNNFSFGQPTPQPSSSPFGFGAPASSSSTFGFASAPAASGPTTFGFGNPPSSAGGPFGFGAAPASSSSTFGFGAATPSATPGAPFGFAANPATSGSIFGATPNSSSFGFGTTATPATGSTFGFGATPASSSSMFGFGAPSSSSGMTAGLGWGTTPSTGAGFGSTFPSFGQSSSSTLSFGAPTTTSLFGSAPTNPTAPTPGGFGTFSFAPTATPSTGYGTGIGMGMGMGSSSPFATSTPGGMFGGMFSAPGSSSLTPFGFSSTAPNQMGLTSLTPFGTTPSMMMLQPMAAQMATPTRPQLTPEQHFQLIKMAYDASHQNPGGHFRKLLYNVVVEGDVSKCLQYLRYRDSGISASLWNQAMLQNADPNRLVPVAITSFSDLHDRVLKQQEQFQAYLSALSNLRRRLNAVVVTHEGPTLTKLDVLKQTQRELTLAVSRVVARVQARKFQGFPLNVTERELQFRVAAMHAELASPSAFQSKVNELTPWVAQAAATASAKASSQAQVQATSQDNNNNHNKGVGMDPAIAMELLGLLTQQKEKLKALCGTLKADLHEMQVIQDCCGSAFPNSATPSTANPGEPPNTNPGTSASSSGS